MMHKAVTINILWAIMLIASCSQSEHHEEREGKTFVVTSPIRKDTILTTEYVCQIHAIQHIELRAMEKGYLEKTYVDEGQFVKKGQPMFQIMPMLYEAELQIAKAEANFVEIEYENTKKLADSEIVSQNELALAKAKYDKAKAEVSLAKVHLDFTTIKAPFDGIMDRLDVRLGSLLDEGELLTILSDNSEMWVYFNVPEAEYLNYKTIIKKDSLLKVKLLMANNKMFSYSGVVETIEADFNNETGNIAFRATFPNPKGLLRHGETGNIIIETPIKNALIIPQKSTYEILDKKYVFTVDENNVLKSKQISIAEEMPHVYIVKSGLEDGEKILLDGINLVKENEEIHFEFIEPESVMSHLNLYAE